MTDYSDALYAATRIVETKRKMDAVDKNDGYVHQDFNNARMDHDTAKSLYALQVAEAVLSAGALSPPAGARDVASIADVPLGKRPGFREERRSPLSKALGKLRREFGLVGTVLIDFSSDHVGVCSSGSTDEFARHMETLGDQILAAIDNGQFVPKE